MKERCESKHPIKNIQCGMPAGHKGSHQNGWQNTWQDFPFVKPCAGNDCDGECSNKDCPAAKRLLQNEVTVTEETPTKIDKPEWQTFSTTAQKDRHYICEIGRLFWGDDKDCYAACAVYEKVKKELSQLREALAIAWSENPCASDESLEQHEVRLLQEAVANITNGTALRNKA